jgi:hypothetical protein
VTLRFRFQNQFATFSTSLSVLCNLVHRKEELVFCPYQSLVLLCTNKMTWDRPISLNPVLWVKSLSHWLSDGRTGSISSRSIGALRGLSTTHALTDFFTRGTKHWTTKNLLVLHSSITTRILPCRTPTFLGKMAALDVHPCFLKMVGLVPVWTSVTRQFWVNLCVVDYPQRWHSTYLECLRVSRTNQWSADIQSVDDVTVASQKLAAVYRPLQARCSRLHGSTSGDTSRPSLSKKSSTCDRIRFRIDWLIVWQHLNCAKFTSRVPWVDCFALGRSRLRNKHMPR